LKARPAPSESPLQHERNIPAAGSATSSRKREKNALILASSNSSSSERHRRRIHKAMLVKPFPSKTHIGNHKLHPETLTSQERHDHHGQLQSLAMSSDNVALS
jgi:hypothetical protein